MKKEIENIIGYWLANRKNTMNFSLLEKGIQNLLNKQREEIKKKIEKVISGMCGTGAYNEGYARAMGNILKELK